jgi:hypothetical protein
MASAKQLLAARSRSVEYLHDAVDDARRVDGVWYQRDIITRRFVPRALQGAVPAIGVHELPRKELRNGSRSFANGVTVRVPRITRVTGRMRIDDCHIASAKKS